ncbi:MAG: T9SS type A sorting domain-containing protein [Chitinophagaceae bacterium]|nr:T9SS type A sorting domain-containing protein [Chitinophagaceae bacterium]
MTYINGTTLVTQTNTTGLFQNLSANTYAINVSVTGSSLTQSFNIIIQAPDPVFCNCTGGEGTNNKPNIQLWINPYASDMDFENQGPIIFAKDYFIDGVFSVDENVTFVDCSFYFTPGSSIVIDHNYKLALLGCDLQSGCNEMWDGIYADHSSEELFIAGSHFQDMETGIQILNNAKITSLDSKYQDNRYGINLNNINSAANCKIERNTFMKKSGLIAPFTLEDKPKCGLNIMNCDDIYIGNNPYPSSGNIFKDIWNGIYITETSSKTWTNPNANIYLNHNHFYDIVGNGPLYGAGIVNDANGWGIYAYKSILNAHLTVRVKGDGINGDTDDHFKRCDRGIMLRRVTGDIVKNRMSDMVIGVMAVECFGQHYKITGNKIDKVHLGIYKSGDESMVGTYIGDNIIDVERNTNIPTTSVGLRPAGITSEYSSITNIGTSIIYGNTVNMLDPNKATGINLSRGSRDIIEANRVHLLNPTTDNALAIPNMIGIYGNANDNVNVSGNLIDNGFYINNNVTYVPNNNAGIYLNANPNSIVSCNDGNFLKYGLFAVGANGSLSDYKRTTSNIMNCSDADWMFWKLNVEGTMGQVGKETSFFPPEAYDANNTFLDPPSVINGTAPIALNRVFRVTDCVQNFSDEIVTDASKLVQTQSTASNPPPNVCWLTVTPPPSITETHTCPDPMVIADYPHDLDMMRALLVVGDSISYEDFPEGARRSDEELIFTWLRDQDSLRTSNPILDSFYISMHSDIVGSLSDVDLDIAALSDSTLMADSVAWHNQLILAKQGNNSLGNSDIFEQNAKWINGLYLRVLEFTLDSISAVEIESIGILANTCPYLGGNAVYRARVLYSHFMPGIHYDDLELCNGQGVYKNGESKLQQQLKSIKDYQNKKSSFTHGIEVYPVPTNSQLNISYYFPEGESGEFVLYDILGRKQLKTTLNENANKAILNVGYLPSGIYMYSIYTNKNRNFSGKIIVE